MGKSTRYILTHQSEHVDTWCNCSTHIHVSGDSTGTASIRLKKEGAIVNIEFSKCDCKFWSQWNIPADEPDEKLTFPEGTTRVVYQEGT